MNRHFVSEGSLAPHWPLNRDASFTLWPPFDPGLYLDMNPSFVSLGPDENWAVFCRYQVPPVPGEGSVWAVRVNAELRPIGRPSLLIGQGLDPRVINLAGRLLVFVALIEHDPVIKEPIGCAMAIAEFVLSGDTWTCVSLSGLPKRPVQGQKSADSDEDWEKNWIPFVIDETHVGLIYSHEPWDILTLQAEPGQTPHLMGVDRSPGLTWEEGTIRGGTPAVPYDEGHLITFFHASQIIGSRRLYSVGACVFMAKPPFAPVLQTVNPLLMARYKTNALRFGWDFAGSVVFPGGVETTPEGYRLLCGIDDGEIGSFLIRRADLEERLEPWQSGVVGRLLDYRGREAVPLQGKSLLYAPEAIPAVRDLPMINFIRILAGHGRTFVDAGAHIGYYAMGLAAGFERVVAFEPSRFQYKWLLRNRALNDYGHILCEQIALGEAAGEAMLNVLNSEAGLNTLSPEAAAAHNIIDQYRVRVEALDSRGLSDVDLLKLGVEGFEIPVLLGAKATIDASRPVILIDVPADYEHRVRVRQLIYEMGYTFEPHHFPLSPKLVLCLPRERRASYEWFI